MDHAVPAGPFDAPSADKRESPSSPHRESPIPTSATTAEQLAQDPSLTAMTGMAPGLTPRLDDPYVDLEFFTRKEIMRIAIDNGLRLYQQLVIKDQKLGPLGSHVSHMDACLEHVVVNLSKYMNDHVMGLAFARAEQQLSHHEDPWVLSIMRERERIALMAATMGGP